MNEINEEKAIKENKSILSQNKFNISFIMNMKSQKICKIAPICEKLQGHIK